MMKNFLDFTVRIVTLNVFDISLCQKKKSI